MDIQGFPLGLYPIVPLGKEFVCADHVLDILRDEDGVQELVQLRQEGQTHGVQQQAFEGDGRQQPTASQPPQEARAKKLRKQHSDDHDALRGARRLSGNQDIIGDDDLCVAVDGIRQPVPGQRPSVRLQNVPPTMRGPDDKHGHCEVWLRQRQLAEQLALFVLLEVRPLGLGQNPTIVYVVEGFVVEPMINVTHLVDRRSADEVQREEQHVDLHEEIKDDAREDADRDSVKHAVEPLRGAHRRHHRGAINVLRQVDALGPRQGLLLARDKSAQQPGGAVALLAAHRRTGSHRSLA
mmetsp:Transcript_56396/g.163545  ORF Transcript_56396/g.163545 Transcript_56396/m.163545 type:complete len:295 (-) Transcript_56396:98-982(-)